MPNADVERVRALRAAFMDGALCLHNRYFGGGCPADMLPAQVEPGIRERAANAFPMPTVEMQRIEPDPVLEDYEWSVIYRSDAMVHHRYKRGAWMLQWDGAITRERVQLWDDLFANPTIRVAVDSPEVTNA